MSTRMTASEQLDRLLYILPVAARAGGCRLDELASTLGTTVTQVVRDIEEVTARAYYHRSGGGEDLQITIDAERVQVWTTGEFRRPLRLSPLEALALALGFRILAADAEPTRRSILLEMATNLETRTPRVSADELAAGFAIDPGNRGDADLLATLRQAARDRRQCRIEYLKPTGAHAESRTIHPYTLMRSGLGWYAVGYCATREDVRAFRLDRVLSATPLAESFTLPEDFNPEEWVASGGRVYRAATETEVVVRYSPRIARWIRERGPVEERDDGSVVVRHRVADPGWAVRHVLQYGTEAEILQPPSLRSTILDLLEELAGPRRQAEAETAQETPAAG